MIIPRAVALWAIATLIAASSAVSFAESYRALLDWAAGHGLAGVWAALFPLMIDTFILVGELSLFVAMVERWATNSRYAAWAVVGVGLCISVLGNVGHVSVDSVTTRGTAAVPPIAAAASLAVGLGVLKRLRTADATGFQNKERAASNLLQRARDAYVACDYPAALRFINAAEQIWPPMAEQLAKARVAVLAAQDELAIEEAIDVS